MFDDTKSVAAKNTIVYIAYKACALWWNNFNIIKVLIHLIKCKILECKEVDDPSDLKPSNNVELFFGYRRFEY